MGSESSRKTGYRTCIDKKYLCVSTSDVPDQWKFTEFSQASEVPAEYTRVHFYRPFVLQPTELSVASHPGFESTEPVRTLLEPTLFIEFQSDSENNKHLAEPFYKLSKSRASGYNSYASVLSYDRHCIVFHFLNGRLHLANSFPGRNPEEILYFILASPIQSLGDAGLTRFEVMAPPNMMPGISEVFSRHLPNTGSITPDQSIDISEAGTEYANIAWLLKFLATCE